MAAAGLGFLEMVLQLLVFGDELGVGLVELLQLSIELLIFCRILADLLVGLF